MLRAPTIIDPPCRSLRHTPRNVWLISVVKLYNSLTSFVKQMREDSQSGEIEQQAGRFIEEPVYSDATKRVKKRKRFFDETGSDETDLSPRKKFRVNTYNSVLDCLSNELHKRACAYEEITKMISRQTLSP